MFGADTSSSVHIDNMGKDNLIFGEVPRQSLDGTTFTAGAKYPINFIQSRKRFVLSLHYNESNSFLFVNATNVYQFKAKKNSEIKVYALFLGNVLKYFTINNMIETGLKGTVHFFSVYSNPIEHNDILDIHKHLIERT